MIKTKFITSYTFLGILFCSFLALSYFNETHAKNINGFDLNNLSIDQTEVFSGGPGRDGIPSINQPKFISPKKVTFLSDNDQVISFTQDSVTKAYPLRILVWHEIVNDSINGKPIAVTYCPLCGTAMVFDRVIDGKTKSFGVSGLLYRSDVLMYDRESLSLWSQLGMKGVSKEAIGKKLSWLLSQQMTWKAWQAKYPNGMVLSTDTGYQRQYLRQAYARYFASKYVMFPVPRLRDELAEKSKVIGVIINGIAKALLLGKGVEKNSDKAIRWLEKSAEQSNKEAQLELSKLYSQGYSVPKDETLAQSWLARAIETGSAETISLFDMLKKSIGFSLKVYEESPEQLLQRAKDGNVQAQYELGVRYESGAWDVEKDNAAALSWIRRSASNGYVVAMETLVDIYHHGDIGVQVDEKEAKLWASKISHLQQQK